MHDTVSELRERAARELKAARHASNEEERLSHRTVANALKALANNEAWLQGRIRPVNGRLVRERRV